MNVYKLLRLAGNHHIPRFVKIIGLWGMHITGRRYIGLFFDPVMACNLRCRMCLFSDENKRAEMKGIVSNEALDAIERTFFHRALKLQLGCSAEPTLYKNLDDIVARGRRAQIPQISLITNGQLIADGVVDLKDLVNKGLTEITLSTHGTQASTYEYLMPGAKFDKLLTLLNIIKEVKDIYPNFKVRVNFTVNSMNMHDLAQDRFFEIWPAGLLPDIVQLRPVQNLGESQWKDFDMQPLLDNFDTTIGNVVAKCHQHGILCLAPTREQIVAVPTPQDGVSSLIEDLTYYYISPNHTYKSDFNLGVDTFRSYHRRHKTASRLFKAIFCSRLNSRHRNVTKKINYTVK